MVKTQDSWILPATVLVAFSLVAFASLGAMSLQSPAGQLSRTTAQPKIIAGGEDVVHWAPGSSPADIKKAEDTASKNAVTKELMDAEKQASLRCPGGFTLIPQVEKVEVDTWQSQTASMATAMSSYLVICK